eukprot:gnl/Hemi2/27980_TR9237_c0_g1_i1.p1 gnl/Hemi2/27980_TR9237_c0_g1~~gnl/Hemi2/27980_TR9237_c0_g1_i1.p1  ORF type:complete len:533 (+),score=77.87 gnl/Hemi2/27980_TR9237_c0_g1_i1:265-1863(+)
MGDRVKIRALGNPRTSNYMRDIKTSASERARQAMKAHIQDDNIAHVSSKYKTEIDRMYKQHNDHLENLRVQSEHESAEYWTLKEQLGDKDQQLGALRYTIDLLRKKLNKMSAREMENQRKLKVFTKLDPIFEKLRTRFQFDSPEEVIDRLESLENQQLQMFERRGDVELDCVVLQRRYDQLVVQQKQVEQQLRLGFEKQMAKKQKEYHDSEAKLADLNSRMKKANEDAEKLYELTGVLENKWHQWNNDISSTYKNSATENRPLEAPTTTDPLGLVTSLDNMWKLNHRSAAQTDLRELTYISNHIVRKHMPNVDPAKYRNNPKMVFETFDTLLNKQSAKINKLQKKYTTMKETNINLEKENEELTRDNLRLKAELTKLHLQFRINIGDTLKADELIRAASSHAPRRDTTSRGQLPWRNARSRPVAPSVDTPSLKSQKQNGLLTSQSLSLHSSRGQVKSDTLLAPLAPAKSLGLPVRASTAPEKGGGLGVEQPSPSMTPSVSRAAGMTIQLTKHRESSSTLSSIPGISSPPKLV